MHNLIFLIKKSMKIYIYWIFLSLQTVSTKFSLDVSFLEIIKHFLCFLINPRNNTNRSVSFNFIKR